MLLQLSTNIHVVYQKRTFTLNYRNIRLAQKLQWHRCTLEINDGWYSKTKNSESFVGKNIQLSIIKKTLHKRLCE